MSRVSACAKQTLRRADPELTRFLATCVAAMHCPKFLKPEHAVLRLPRGSEMPLFSSALVSEVFSLLLSSTLARDRLLVGHALVGLDSNSNLASMEFSAKGFEPPCYGHRSRFSSHSNPTPSRINAQLHVGPTRFGSDVTRCIRSKLARIRVCATRSASSTVMLPGYQLQ